ncbi:MAG: homoprotocatechuate degradation operon regulator HpaR [Acidimicrobiales bacterium]|nr:homoprotocatechuate degradation operon regulator HpaR [Acidimicrobiales bacterium]
MRGEDEQAMRPFSASLPMALLLARESTMRRFRPLLADHGLTEQQWRVLRALAASDHPIEVTVLADRTALLAPSITRIVARLVDDGLIHRSAVPSDARRSVLELTAKGRRLVARIAPKSEATYADIEAAFGTERLATLLTELHELAAIIEPDTQEAP